MALFRHQRGTSVIPNSTRTVAITEGTDYHLHPIVTDTTRVWCKLVNTRHSGCGRTSSGGSQNLDDVSVRIDNPTNILSGLTFRREGLPPTDCRVTWQISQYIGPAGGPYEVIARAHELLSTAATSDTALTGASIATLANTNKAVALLTSQAGGDTGRNNNNDHLWGLEWTGTSPNIKVVGRRNTNPTDHSQFSYTVLDFTGSKWRNVTRDDFTVTGTANLWSTTNQNNFDTRTIGTALLDTSRAFLMDVQFRHITDVVSGIDDAGQVVEIDPASTTLYRVRRNTDNESGDKRMVVWVAELDDPDIDVEHISFYDGTITGTEERVWDQSITDNGAMANVSIEGLCASTDGTGAGHPRGVIDARLEARNNVKLTESDTGQEDRIAFDVVRWPTGDYGGIIT